MSRERGTVAVAAALVALAVSAAIGVAVNELARTELVLAEHRRAAAGALAAADACLADALAAIAPGWDFAGVLAGPDGVAATVDDGTVATPAGCTASATGAPGAGVPPSRLLIRLDAQAQGGRRMLEAIIARGPVPAALLWLAALPPAGSVGGSIAFDGVDAGGGPPWASLAAPASLDALDAWTAAAGASLSASGGTLPAWSAAPPPLSAFAARVRTAPHGDASALVTTGAPPPSLTYVAGDLAIDVPRRGTGVLFVDGALDIRAGLDFTGIVVASGDVRVASGASLTVAGAAWVGSSLDVDGAVTLRADAAAIAAADALVPLPRRAVVPGQRDLG